MAKISICTYNAIAVACTIFLSSCGVHITPQVKGNTQIEITQEGDTIYRAEEEPFVEDQEPESLRDKVAARYTAEIGIRERTGKNDGKDVEKYLASVGLGKGNAWCAAFVHWVFEVCGIVTPITAWSPTAENKKKIRYKNGKTFGPGPQKADVITLYYASKGRIGHTGFFDHMINSSMEASVEGNTNGEHSREGDGVYLVFRPLKTINSISSWID
jgi:hypothetical protein